MLFHSPGRPRRVHVLCRFAASLSQSEACTQRLGATLNAFRYTCTSDYTAQSLLGPISSLSGARAFSPALQVTHLAHPSKTMLPIKLLGTHRQSMFVLKLAKMWTVCLSLEGTKTWADFGAQRTGLRNIAISMSCCSQKKLPVMIQQSPSPPS